MGLRPAGFWTSGGTSPVADVGLCSQARPAPMGAPTPDKEALGLWARRVCKFQTSLLS
jgi:hypothetical protein